VSPQRIQLRRTKGWRKPEGAIVVARPSKWGNPYRLIETRDGFWGVRSPTTGWFFLDKAAAAEFAVKAFRGAFRDHLVTDHDNGFAWEGYPSPRTGSGWISASDVKAELRGHDLACWCPLDQPCHADVLLELANGGPG
jgi:hypothetical protein